MPKSKAKKQMKRLFEDGGLLQEGGTVDEKSGNEVPVGSLKKEVRDDIPAQLSEGEFVFPADVVRFIGLQKLMELRQAAKEGLSKMEAMGQMGNSDEATEEDTGEFETELDEIFKEIEEEGTSSKKDDGEQLKMQVGGAVTGTTQQAAVPPKPNPFSVPFSVERYSKEGEKDIFMPTFGGKAQAAVPEGFEKSAKVQSFGGVFRKADEAQKTATSGGSATQGIKLNATPTITPKTDTKTTDLTKTDTKTTDLTKTDIPTADTQQTTDLTKTTQPVPETYKGLDTDPLETNTAADLPKKVFLKEAGTLSEATRESIWNSTGTYTDPVSGKDLTPLAARYLSKKLTDLGITDFGQIEKQVIKGSADRYEGDSESSYFVPGTPDVTKYFNKATGKEINPVLLDDKAGTKYVLAEQGIQKQFDPVAKVAAQLVPYIDKSSTGGAWSTQSGKSSGPGFGTEGFLKKMAENFYNQTGLTDLSKLGVRTTTEYDYESGTPYNATTYYNKDTGKAVKFNGTLGGYGEGPGWTHTRLSFEGDKPVIKTTGEDTSDLGTILPALTILTLPFGGIGGIVGSLGIGSSVSASLISVGLSEVAANVVTGALLNSAASGIMASIAGGDVKKAMIGGAVSGGIGAGATEIANGILGADTVNSISKATNLTAKQVSSVFASSIASGVNTAISGGDFSDIAKSFGESLLASGVSEVAVTNAVKQLKGSVPESALKGIGTATKMLSNIAINASLKGLDVNKAIEYYGPQIMMKALTAPPTK